MSYQPQENDNSQINDKVLFTVSFLALFLALAPFKDELSSRSITYFSVEFSLYDSLLTMAAILFLSVYANAIENLRNTKLCGNWSFLKYFGSFADNLYIVAIAVYPVSMIAVLTIFFLVNLVLKSVLNVDTISLISSLISTITVIYNIQKMRKTKSD